MSKKKRNDLENLLSQLKNCQGPFVIIGRPHSGTSFLAETFIENGIFMGSRISKGFLDSEDWYKRFVFPLITSEFFPDWNKHLSRESFRKLCNDSIRKTLNNFFNREFHNQTWGWKLSETLFIMPIIKKYFPNVKFINIIRDGRDVVLSDNGYFQLTSRPDYHTLFNPITIVSRIKMNIENLPKNKYRNYCLKITFNSSKIKEWRGIEITNKKAILKNRFTIQMQSWINCIKTAREYSKSMECHYHEIKYEDLCINPLKEAEKLFEFLNICLIPKTKEYLLRNANKKRIGKWKDFEFKNTEYDDFKNAIEIGKPLLNELGYMV